MPQHGNNGSNGGNGHGTIKGDEIIQLPRETPYDPSFCAAIVAWFSGERTERVIKRERKIKQKDGSIAQEVEWETLGRGMPTFDGFAAQNDIDPRTLRKWAATRADFGQAFTRARAMQRDWLVELGTRNLVQGSIYGYTMSNISEWRSDPKPSAASDKKAVFHFDPMKDSRAIAEAKQQEAPRVPG